MCFTTGRRFLVLIGFTAIFTLKLKPIEALNEETIPLKSIHHVDLEKKYFRSGNSRYDAKTGAALAVYGVGYVTKGEDPESKANDFLSNNRDILNLDAPTKSESLEVVATRKTGVWTTIRFKQKYNGIPVYDADIAITINEKNEVRMVASKYKKGVFLETDTIVPKRSKNDIQSFASNKYAKGSFENFRHYSEEMVIYHEEKGASKLAWKVVFRANDDITEIEAVWDDKTGEILLENDITLDKKGGRDKQKSIRPSKPILEAKTNVSPVKRTNIRLQNNLSQRQLEDTNNPFFDFIFNSLIGPTHKVFKVFFPFFKCDEFPSQSPTQNNTQSNNTQSNNTQSNNTQSNNTQSNNTQSPSHNPSQNPISSPISSPSLDPSQSPSLDPSQSPSSNPSLYSSLDPSQSPSSYPSQNPSSTKPSPQISDPPTLFPSSAPTTSSPTTSLSPSTSPPVRTAIGWVFDPDPLSTAGVKYCDEGYCDNADRNSRQLSAQLVEVTMPGLKVIDETVFLSGPYVEIVDVDRPNDGIFEQRSDDFRYNRGDPQFEAVNCYYHIDHFMRYINEDLNITVMPRQYDGPVRVDPHASNGNDNSFFSIPDGTLNFGQGGVDDAEDADVILHELGHALHDWLTVGGLSQEEGLSEGIGDYIAASYARYKGLRRTNEEEYYWMFKWDGHNQFWNGRIYNYDAEYPNDLVGQVHTDGQIWATCNMKIWDLLGREKSDKAHLIGISATNGGSTQEDVANAILLAAFDLGYSAEEVQDIKDIYLDCGYRVSLAVCGNGIIEDFEECDVGIGDATCAGNGCATGTPSCTSSCLLDYSECLAGPDQLHFKLDLTFDRFSSETSWRIWDTSDGSTLYIEGGDDYEDLANENIMREYCFLDDVCYTFTIADSYADGICCSFGDGDYEVFIDDVAISGTSPQFGSGRNHEFGSCSSGRA